MAGILTIEKLSPVNHSQRIVAAKGLNLVNLNVLFNVAMKNRFAIPAINIRNFPIPKDGNYKNGYLGPSTVVACFRVMQKLNSPLILEIAQSEYGYAGPKTIFGEEAGFQGFVDHILVEAKKMGVKQPFAIHFDHGEKTEYMKAAVKAGFTSVAMDGGTLENWDALIAKAREWVNYCHPRGVTVEGEIETVGGEKPTEPKEAIKFVEQTGVDVIVVTLPKNVHGAKKGESKLDMNRLLGVSRKVPNPVNLHGGSGFPYEDITAAVEAGAIHKLNYATEVFRYIVAAVPGMQDAINEAAGLEKSVTDPKKGRKTMFKLFEGGANSFIAKIGADAVRAAEDAGMAEIIRIMEATKNVGTARLY